MSERHAILARLSQAIHLLDKLSDEFVFLGGSVVPLLITDEAAQDARPTNDIDVIIRAATTDEYEAVKTKLEVVGFMPSFTEDEECRFTNGTLFLDVMPSEKNVLGFGDAWCKRALTEYFAYELPTQCQIKIIKPPVFICTKLSAYDERRIEHDKDLVDIVSVVDGRRELLYEIEEASDDIRSFISTKTSALLSDGLSYKISSYLPKDIAGAAREQLVLSRLIQMTQL